MRKSESSRGRGERRERGVGKREGEKKCIKTEIKRERFG